MTKPVGAAPSLTALLQEPVSRQFGADRGTTIRRYYIETFLASRRADLAGDIVEIGDDRYARAFGAPDATVSVLSPGAGPQVTHVADLVSGEGVPEGAFDAAIVTQVLHVLPDMSVAIRHLWRALKPGGVLLASLPCISQVSRYDMDRWGDYWRVTDRGAQALFWPVFGAANVETIAYGNHLAAVASLSGYAAEEFEPCALDDLDPEYQVLICVRARKTAP